MKGEVTERENRKERKRERERETDRLIFNLLVWSLNGFNCQVTRTPCMSHPLPTAGTGFGEIQGLGIKSRSYNLESRNPSTTASPCFLGSAFPAMWNQRPESEMKPQNLKCAIWLSYLLGQMATTGSFKYNLIILFEQNFCAILNTSNPYHLSLLSEIQSSHISTFI